MWFRFYRKYSVKVRIVPYDRKWYNPVTKFFLTHRQHISHILFLLLATEAEAWDQMPLVKPLER